MNDIKMIKLENAKDLLVFHDAILEDIVLSYDNKNLVINLELDSTTNIKGSYKLQFNGVTHFNMDVLEPWGSSNWISELKTEHLENNIRIHILLNSGDVIELQAESMTLTEQQVKY